MENALIRLQEIAKGYEVIEEVETDSSLDYEDLDECDNFDDYEE